MRHTVLLPLIIVVQALFWPQGSFAAKPQPTPFLNGTFRALVIGNDAYRDPQEIWAPLKTAVNGAEAVASLLREQYKFGNVRLLKNATRRETDIKLG